MDVRHYRPGDEPGILECWNRALTCDPVSLEVFERKVLLDPNFECDGAILAVSDGKCFGYAQCFVRHYPNMYDGLEEEKGWVTVLASTDERLYPSLLRAADEYFRARSRREVWFSSYTPNYFWPGVDKNAYPAIHRALLAAGYNEVYDALAMDADLWPTVTRPENIDFLEEKLGSEGYDIHELRTSEIVPLLSFLRQNFSADWYRHFLDLASRGAARDQVVVATHGEEVVGYAQYWGAEGYDWACGGEHFGPFGVKPSLRGKGIGTLILNRCLQNMRKKGVHRAFFLWTDPKAARLYERFGFKLTRRFTVMRKVL
jgi:GNAT superfamily N-acetyltransferase